MSEPIKYSSRLRRTLSKWLLLAVGGVSAFSSAGADGRVNPDGSITFDFSGISGSVYQLEFASHLTPPIGWSPLSTNVIGTDETWQFTDTNAAGRPQGFYRTAPLSLAGAVVTVDRSAPQGKSEYCSSFSQVDNSLDYPFGSNNGAAVTNARALMAQGIEFVNNPIMAWGVADPWPDPAATSPTNWSWLDKHLNNIIRAGCTPMLTLCEAPWWMKGQYRSDGSTKLIPDVQGEWAAHTYAGVFTDFRGIQYTNYTSPDPYGCRILDSQMTNWLRLVRGVAERYMAPPYNVRYFQVWNEMKGYYNPILNRWDYKNNPGDTNGYHAQHGYTWMYNQVYQQLTNAAGALGIAHSNLYVGGPYVVMDSGAAANIMSNPSRVTGPWGVLDQRALDVVSYWLTNKFGAGFVCVDGGSDNKFGGEIADPFTRCGKFSTVNNWIRQQPGAASLPIVWAEWYNSTNGGALDDDFNNALGTWSAIGQLKSGAALTLLWSAQASSVARPPLWSSTSQSGGGVPTPWYFSYKTLNQEFGRGTNYYFAASSSTNLAVLASLTKTLLVNKSTNTVVVNVDNKTNVVLGRYGVVLLDAH